MKKSTIFNFHQEDEDDSEINDTIVPSQPINRIDLIFQIVGYSFLFLLAVFTYFKISEHKNLEQNFAYSKDKVILFCSFYAINTIDDKLKCTKEYNPSNFTKEKAKEFEERYKTFLQNPNVLMDEMRIEENKRKQNESIIKASQPSQHERLLKDYHKEKNQEAVEKN